MNARQMGLILVVAAVLMRVAQADYVNPPGWTADADFTHQVWDFSTNAVPLTADGGYVNAFGAPTVTEVWLGNPAYMMWVQDMMFGGTRHGLWGGMVIGLPTDQPAASVTAYLPNHARPAPWVQDLWIQVVYWGAKTNLDQQIKVELASDAAFQDVLMAYWGQVSDLEDQSATGTASTGQYWRFTHSLSLAEQPGGEYLRISLIPQTSYAVFFDSVAVDTRCRTTGPAVCPGDGNCDGAVNWRDIDYLIAAMNDNQPAWQALFLPPGPSCMFANLDASHDGHVNWRDIDPFIAVMNTTCP